MRSYREYFIRCKTCNEQIACHASVYEDLLGNGLTIEEALNTMDIMLPCSRAAFMNPTYVTYNMENRDVVEGLRTAESVEDDFMQRDPATQSTSNPVFAPCLAPGISTVQGMEGTMAVVPRGAAPVIPVLTAPAISTATQAFNARLGAVGVQTITQPARVPARPITPQRQLTLQPLMPVKPTVVPPIIAPIIDINPAALAMPIGPGIDVQSLALETEFQEPTIPGVPTINHNPKRAPVTVYVGAGRYCTVLNGRTYLAQ